jgi:hypothetical protein
MIAVRIRLLSLVSRTGVVYGDLADIDHPRKQNGVILYDL